MRSLWKKTTADASRCGWSGSAQSESHASKAENHRVEMPAPMDPGQRQLLQAVWDVLSTQERWPTFNEVDRHLYRMHGLDVAEVLHALPSELIYGGGERGAPRPDEQLRLTIAGVAACAGSNEDLAAFIEFVRHAAEVERGWTGPPLDPTLEPSLTTAGAEEAMSLPAAGRAALLRRLGYLLLVEPWGWTSGGIGPEGWQFGFGRGVRLFSGTRDVEDYWSRRPRLDIVPPLPMLEEIAISTSSTPATVFLVHGHDQAAKHQVARVLHQLTGEEPVILDEQASRGRTLVEKFEQHAVTAAFAVVLLTPDDFGGVRDGQEQARARQNVVFELGYFFGKLGRGSVAVLNAGVERPSDVDGIAYISFPAGNWQVKLGQEMDAAGVAVDLNRLR